MNNIERFIESIESSNSQKVAKFAFKSNTDNIENYNQIELEQFILDRNPSSPKEIITIIYIISSYAKWLRENGITDNDNFIAMIQSLDKKLLWEKSKPYAKKKFISYEEYKTIVKDIATYEEYNGLYFEMLFSCIYHGIYNDNMSVLKNLRSNDIQDNGIVTLREDDSHIYKIKIPIRLAKDLKQLASINKWFRRNRFGLCQVDMTGIHSDSVFKVENRSTNSEDSYKFSYYSKLRKISKEYIGHTLLPLQLYTSGIMYRIKTELNNNNISLDEAFANNSRNKMAHLIIQKELIRCNSCIEIGNFRELVKGHLNSF